MSFRATGTTAQPTSSGVISDTYDRRVVPTLVFIGLLVAVVSSLGAPLIPTIAQADHVALSTAQWVLTAALMSGAVMTPIMGRLADGRRQRDVILLTLFVVGIGCILAAVSTSFSVLVIGRGLQGVGLGLLPVNMATARRNLPHDVASRAIATLSVSTAVGVGVGYPLTGVITEIFSFRAAYWFGAIVVVVAMCATAVVLPARSNVPKLRFDVVGALALGAVVITVSVVLSEGGAWGWSSARAIVLAVGCFALGLWWVRHELRCALPIVELRHLGNRPVLTANLSGFLVSLSMYLLVPVVVEFIQTPSRLGFGFGSSVMISGLVLVPLSAGTFIASRFLVAYERRFGVRTMIPLGAIVFSVASAFFAVEHRALWEAFVTVGIAGLGIGFTFAAMPGFIIRAVPPAETGSATGFYQVLRSIGLSVGSALGATVLLSYTRPGAIYPAVGGFTTSLIISAILGVATAMVSFVLPGRKTARLGPPAHEREVEIVSIEKGELAGVMLAAEEPLVEEQGNDR